MFVLHQECLCQYNNFCIWSHICWFCYIICLSFIIICLNWFLSFFLASAWEVQNPECLWLLKQIFWCVFMLCCWVCNSWRRSIVFSRSRTVVGQLASGDTDSTISQSVGIYTHNRTAWHNRRLLSLTALPWGHEMWHVLAVLFISGFYFYCKNLLHAVCCICHSMRSLSGLKVTACHPLLWTVRVLVWHMYVTVAFEIEVKSCIYLSIRMICVMKMQGEWR